MVNLRQELLEKLTRFEEDLVEAKDPKNNYNSSEIDFRRQICIDHLEEIFEDIYKEKRISVFRTLDFTLRQLNPYVSKFKKKKRKTA